MIISINTNGRKKQGITQESRDGTSAQPLTLTAHCTLRAEEQVTVGLDLL